MVSEPVITQCPGCKVMLPETDYPADNRYGVVSAACREAFDEILVQEGVRYGCPDIHRFIINAYSVQHPPHLEHQRELGISERFVAASIQSVSIHLIALYLVLEKKVAFQEIGRHMDRVLKHMNQQGVTFAELTPPDDLGEIRAADVRDALDTNQSLSLEEYSNLVWQWSESAWNAWKDHHATIRILYGKYH